MELPASHSPSLAQPFRAGLRQGVIRYQTCRSCGTPQALARYACCNCASEDLSWREARGTGTVYAQTLVTRAPSEAFRALAPYVLVLVDLDEGPRLMGHGEPGLTIGARVAAATFEQAGETLLLFRRDVTHPL